MAQLWHPNFNGRVPQYVKNNIHVPPTFEMFIYYTLQSYSNTVLSCMCIRAKELHENFRNLTFLYCAFTLTHCIGIYANLSRCAYVLTPCTVIIYLICCFASLCLRIFPLHRNICMRCLFIRGYPLHNEPIDGLVS